MSDYENSWERLAAILGFYDQPTPELTPAQLMDKLETKLSVDGYDRILLEGRYERLLAAARDYYAHHGGTVIGINVAMRDALGACDGE